MDWIFHGFKFSTECRFYRILRADISEPFIREESNICSIYFPKDEICTDRIITEFRLIFFIYAGIKFRLKSIDPVSLTVIQINDLGTTKIDETYTTISILSDNITIDLIVDTLSKDLFEVLPSQLDILIANWDLISNIEKISNWRYHYGDSEFEYVELLTLLINKTTLTSQLNLKRVPINLIDTKDRYLLSFTQCVDAVYSRLTKELTKFKFVVTTKNRTQEMPNREIAYFSFDEYPREYFRQFPEKETDITEYEVPMTLTLNTSSVSKFERLLNEINTLHFLTNIVRVICEDSLGNPWLIALNWKDYNTNSPDKAENERGEVSYMISLQFTMKYYAVRNNKYYMIKEILYRMLNIDRNGDERTISEIIIK